MTLLSATTYTLPGGTSVIVYWEVYMLRNGGRP